MDTLPESIKYDGKKYDVTFRTKFSVIYKIASLSPSKQNDTKITFSDFDSNTNTYTFSIGTGGKKLKGIFTTAGKTPSLKKTISGTRNRNRSTNSHNRFGFTKTKKVAPKKVAPTPPKKKDGAIVIVKDNTGQILLGEEGVRCLQGQNKKQYIDIPEFDILDLKKRTDVTHDLYNHIVGTNPCTVGGNFLVPLVEKSKTIPSETVGNALYGSHPRKKKMAAAAGGQITYSASKGGKEVIDASTLETAIREFIEEVGYDFNDTTRFVPKGTAEDKERIYHVYLVEIDNKEKRAIEQILRDRYARYVGEVFDFKFRDTAGLQLNDLTKDALTKI